MNYTAKDFSRMLAERAESVAQHLFPAGKREGGEWCVGSIDGASGRSLKIRINGEKAGQWADFAAGGDLSGDMIGLWKQARRLDIVSAIREIKAFLGVRETGHQPERKQYERPAIALPSATGSRYLQSRRLTIETINAYRASEEDGEVIFPFYSPVGVLENVKHLAIARGPDGRKKMRLESGCAPALFGWQSIDDDTRAVVITEGEIDAMTMHQYGYPSLSVPMGAGVGHKNDWVDFEWENLERFDTIYVCYDQDEEGKKAVPEVVERLGIHRCRVVKLPGKDANACLTSGVDESLIHDAIKGSTYFNPPEIRPASDYLGDVIDYFYPPPGMEGFRPDLLDGKVTFRPGELTIWTGISGHGKSLLLGQLMLACCERDGRVAICSPEMPPAQTIGRMVRQIESAETPAKPRIEAVLKWMTGRLWVYDVNGNVSAKHLLELMLYSRRRHGVNHIVIDSLMKIAVGSEDYDGQRIFLNDLKSFAIEHLVHVHLVAHARKGKDESVAPGKLDIKGSGDIFGQADNCLCVWRNKPHEEKQRSGAGRDSAPAAIVTCDKQRFSGWEGMVALGFSTEGQLYHGYDRQTR